MGEPNVHKKTEKSVTRQNVLNYFFSRFLNTFHIS